MQKDDFGVHQIRISQGKIIQNMTTRKITVMIKIIYQVTDVFFIVCFWIRKCSLNSFIATASVNWKI